MMKNTKVISAVFLILSLLVLNATAADVSMRTEKFRSDRLSEGLKVQSQSVRAQWLSPSYTPMTSSGMPILAGSMQGGEDILTATVIPSLPFLDSGTTTGYTDDYDASCPTSSNSPDVVYAYTPAVSERVDIKTGAGGFSLSV